MLVLTRSPEQQILFPNLGVTVHVLKVKGRSVRLGIDAPQQVKVLRPETLTEDDLSGLLRGGLPQLDRHQWRNELNILKLQFSLLQRYLAAGDQTQIDRTIGQILEKLSFLEHQVKTPTSAQPEVPSANRTRLLLVEDDDNERELLAELLRLHHFEVETVGDGRQALEYLASHQRPDYVLLDMRMPVLDGRKTLQAIREALELTELKVFAVSGSSPASMGIDDEHLRWFPKPLDTERLVRAMTESAGLTQTPV